LTLVAGCGKSDAKTSGPGGATSAEQPVMVATVHPEQKSLRRVIEQPAHVEAFEETPLHARISGYVQKVHVDIGDRVQGPRYDEQGKLVQAGQVLAELSVPEMEEELRQKRALVDQAEAELKLANESVKAAEAEHNRLKSQFERLAKISGVVDKEIVEETRYGFEVSKAKWSMADAEVGVRKTRVQVAKAGAGRLGALLDYSKIRAPYDGVVTSRSIHTGHYLSGNGTKPLFVIARTDTLRVIVEVPEAEALAIREGVPARIRCPIIKDRDCDGKVTRVSWSLDARARTLRTEIDLANPQGSHRPGMYAYVTFTAELPSTFTLPVAGVVSQGSEAYCFCVEGGKALRTPIRLGVRDSQSVQVLKKLSAGAGADGQKTWQDFTGKEDVILTSPATLTDGQAVTVTGK
jgi:RND family efflux transporter MFP subunit